MTPCTAHSTCKGWPCSYPGAPTPTTHTPADPGADECAADAAGEWLADLAQSGDTDFNTQNTPEEA